MVKQGGRRPRLKRQKPRPKRKPEKDDEPEVTKAKITKRRRARTSRTRTPHEESLAYARSHSDEQLHQEFEQEYPYDKPVDPMAAFHRRQALLDRHIKNYQKLQEQASDDPLEITNRQNLLARIEHAQKIQLQVENGEFPDEFKGAPTEEEHSNTLMSLEKQLEEKKKAFQYVETIRRRTTERFGKTHKEIIGNYLKAVEDPSLVPEMQRYADAQRKRRKRLYLDYKKQRGIEFDSFMSDFEKQQRLKKQILAVDDPKQVEDLLRQDREANEVNENIKISQETYHQRLAMKEPMDDIPAFSRIYNKSYDAALKIRKVKEEFPMKTTFDKEVEDKASAIPLLSPQADESDRVRALAQMRAVLNILPLDTDAQSKLESHARESLIRGLRRQKFDVMKQLRQYEELNGKIKKKSNPLEPLVMEVELPEFLKQSASEFASEGFNDGKIEVFEDHLEKDADGNIVKVRRKVRRTPEEQEEIMKKRQKYRQSDDVLRVVQRNLGFHRDVIHDDRKILVLDEFGNEIEENHPDGRPKSVWEIELEDMMRKYRTIQEIPKDIRHEHLAEQYFGEPILDIHDPGQRAYALTMFTQHDLMTAGYANELEQRKPSWERDDRQDPSDWDKFNHKTAQPVKPKKLHELIDETTKKRGVRIIDISPDLRIPEVTVDQSEIVMRNGHIFKIDKEQISPPSTQEREDRFDGKGFPTFKSLEVRQTDLDDQITPLSDFKEITNAIDLNLDQYGYDKYHKKYDMNHLYTRTAHRVLGDEVITRARQFMKGFESYQYRSNYRSLVSKFEQNRLEKKKMARTKKIELRRKTDPKFRMSDDGTLHEDFNIDDDDNDPKISVHQSFSAFLQDNLKQQARPHEYHGVALRDARQQQHDSEISQYRRWTGLLFAQLGSGTAALLSFLKPLDTKVPLTPSVRNQINAIHTTNPQLYQQLLKDQLYAQNDKSFNITPPSLQSYLSPFNNVKSTTDKKISKLTYISTTLSTLQQNTPNLAKKQEHKNWLEQQLLNTPINTHISAYFEDSMPKLTHAFHSTADIIQTAVRPTAEVLLDNTASLLNLPPPSLSKQEKQLRDSYNRFRATNETFQRQLLSSSVTNKQLMETLKKRREERQQMSSAFQQMENARELAEEKEKHAIALISKMVTGKLPQHQEKHEILRKRVEEGRKRLEKAHEKVERNNALGRLERELDLPGLKGGERKIDFNPNVIGTLEHFLSPNNNDPLSDESIETTLENKITKQFSPPHPSVLSDNPIARMSRSLLSAVAPLIDGTRREGKLFASFDDDNDEDDFDDHHQNFLAEPNLQNKYIRQFYNNTNNQAQPASVLATSTMPPSYKPQLTYNDYMKTKQKLDGLMGHQRGKIKIKDD